MMKKIKQWLYKADEMDGQLSKRVRQLKWIAILTVFFIVYVLTFMRPGEPLLLGGDIPNGRSELSDEVDMAAPGKSAFELPVDSFEKLLNQHIYETSPRKVGAGYDSTITHKDNIIGEFSRIEFGTTCPAALREAIEFL